MFCCLIIYMKTAFSKILCDLREEKNLCQKEVAFNLGVKVSTYSNWENGVCIPSVDKLCKIADLFDVSLDYLIGRSQIRKMVSNSENKKRQQMLQRHMKNIIVEIEEYIKLSHDEK